jgi:hypothetical protein
MTEKKTGPGHSGQSKGGQHSGGSFKNAIGQLTYVNGSK